ncbi:unnamed protein product, partial [Rotaria sordida]
NLFLFGRFGIMVSLHEAKSLFEQLNTNQDGSIGLLATCGQNFRPHLHCWLFSLFDLWPRLGSFVNIDKNEFHNWISDAKGLNSSSYESTTSKLHHYNNTTSQLDRYNYKVSSQDSLGYTADKHASYGTTAVASELIDDTAIHTSSLEETTQYMEKSTNNIYEDLYPRIIQQATTENLVTLQQQIFVRYLQPPAVPPPGPLIIKEVRPQQPSPPPPLVIHEYAPPLPSSPPLTFRERPPTPPPHVPSATIIRTLPAIPVPPRSVVIERFLPSREKPRDIIVERWIPYGPPHVRRTIVEHAPPAIQYPQPSNTIIIYSNAKILRVRNFEKLDVIQEDPIAYVARYGLSLLDPATLVQQARNAGVIEDISYPVLSSSIYATTDENTVHLDQSNEIINQGFSLSRGTRSEEVRLGANTNGINLSNTRSSFLASMFIGNSASTGSANVTRREFNDGDASVTTTHANRVEKLN